MCFEDPTQPYAFPLALRQSRWLWFQVDVMTYSLLLLKVTTLWNGVHRSQMGGGFAYPLRQLVADPHAIMGSHDRGVLHFAASPATAHMLGNFGSHRLAVLPGKALWDPVTRRGLQNRCWHSNSAVPLFCYDCEGVTLDIVNIQTFGMTSN
jgi:hypothetical protein